MQLDSRKSMIISFLFIVCTWALIRLSVLAMVNFLVVDKPLAHADALVVMAGSYSERLPASAKLYMEGKAPKILLTNDGIFSSWSEEKQRNLYQVEWAEDDLVHLQVPANAILKLTYTDSGSIHDALNARTAILAEGMKKIMIVTSDYHARRTLWTFEKVLHGYPVSIGVYPVKSNIMSLPNYKKFMFLGQEMMKFAYYKFRYSSI
jgi:uncharacterized SAM-binding protein YcdF (DUF218 family)